MSDSAALPYMTSETLGPQSVSTGCRRQDGTSPALTAGV